MIPRWLEQRDLAALTLAASQPGVGHPSPTHLQERKCHEGSACKGDWGHAFVQAAAAAYRGDAMLEARKRRAQNGTLPSGHRKA